MALAETAEAEPKVAPEHPEEPGEIDIEDRHAPRATPPPPESSAPMKRMAPRP